MKRAPLSPVKFVVKLNAIANKHKESPVTALRECSKAIADGIRDKDLAMWMYRETVLEDDREKHRAEHNAFSAKCHEAAEKLDVIMEYECHGNRYECIAFDEHDKLVRVSAVFDGENESITPEEISLIDSLEWAANMETCMLFSIDSSGNALTQAEWYRRIAAELGKAGAP